MVTRRGVGVLVVGAGLAVAGYVAGSTAPDQFTGGCLSPRVAVTACVYPPLTRRPVVTATPRRTTTPTPGRTPTAAPAGPGAEYGVQILGGPSTGEAAALDALRPAWVRARVFWSAGIHGWGWSDAVVADAERRGAKLLLEWWINDECFTGKTPADVAAFAGELAARYRGRVAAYQVGNEPDLGGRCGPAASAAEVYAATRQAIQAQDPAAIVVMPGLAMHPVSTSYLDAFLNVTRPEAVAVHVYPVLGDPAAKLAAVKAHARGLPVWVTETGATDAAGLRAGMAACRGAVVCIVYAASNDYAAPWGVWPGDLAGVFAEGAK